jgi:hypothetical protein
MNETGRVVIDLDQLRADLSAARERVRELEGMMVLAERYGRHPVESIATSSESQPQPLAGMGTKAAALWVLETSGRPWKVEELTEEMARLGWHITSDQPASAVRTAVRRLLHDGSVERVRHGFYAFVNPFTFSEDDEKEGTVRRV